MTQEELQALLDSLTLEEKIGQLIQCNAGDFIQNNLELTGPAGEKLPAELLIPWPHEVRKLTLLGLEAALPVYKLYGAESVTGYGIRPGKHEILLEDWLHYLSFADLHL